MSRTPALATDARADALAIAVHLDLFNRQPGRETFHRFNVTRDDVMWALHYAARSPAEVEAETRRMATVLHAVRAPGLLVERVEVITRATDEPREGHAKRWRDAGFFGAVIGHPPHPPSEAAAAQMDAGRVDFLVALSRAAA